MRTRNVGFAVLFLLVAGVTNAFAQTRVVTGRVTDAVSNAPIASAQVVVSGTTISTVTAADGAFTVGVPSGTVALIIRRIGYKRFDVTVAANTSNVQVALEADILRLDEVVVTGQATGIERRNLPNAVSTVAGAEIGRVPVGTIERALQGRVAGANIQSNSGAPGGGVQVELRGVTSFIGRSPLYVVDGVVISDEAIPSNINAVTDAAGGSNPALTQDNQVNRVVDLNPYDIESIEILKGASASAIYGSKASSGVIIIKTKRGRVGRPQVNASLKFGAFDLANTLTRSFDTAAEADAVWGPGTAEANNFDPDRNIEELLAGNNPLSFETAASVAGGDANSRYFVSGLWKDDGGIMDNTGFQKQSLRMNLDQLVGERVSLQVSTNLIHTSAQRGISNNDNTGTSPFFVFAFTPRFADLDVRPDGSFPDNPFERSNPLQTLALMENDEDVWRFIASTRIEWDAIRTGRANLKLISAAGVDRFSQKNELLFPPDLQFEDDDGLPGTSLLSNSDNVAINVSGDAVLTLTPSSGFTSTTSAGVQYSTRDLNVARVVTRNLLAGQANINQGSSVQVSENRQRVEDFGIYLQEEVLINDRLLLTAGIRADQTSANTKSDKLFYFPKAAASYRWTMNSGFIDEIKFRAAYGESGNQPRYTDQYTPLEGRVNIESKLGFQVPAGIANQVVVTDIKPERQREFEGGIDATLFGGRANVEATVFHRSVSDLLLPRQLAPSSGFTQEIFNGGAMRVNGLEAAISVVPFQSADFTWVFRSTFGMNRSKITSLPVPAFIPQNAGFGTDLGSFKIEEGASATQIVGNVPDGSGGATIQKIGDSNPDFKMSFSNDISYKAFNLYGLTEWQQGSDIVNLTKFLYDLADNWEDCTLADNPCGTRLNDIGTNTSVYLESATFLKLREVTLSWNLPQSFVQSLWSQVEAARLTFSGRNLLTFTDYSGMDPEVSNFGNQAIGRNIAVAPFPRTRSFWFGLDVSF